ncbi:MAG: hypothetical protein EAZ63_13030 [Runella slithyformis]|nr:MAG: hypothetical protein EAZ63_13030 [Runella slithyformis]
MLIFVLDFNECLVNNGSCSHECINTAGSYHCSCPEDHVLQSDRLTCTEGENLSGRIIHLVYAH